MRTFFTKKSGPVTALLFLGIFFIGLYIGRQHPVPVPQTTTPQINADLTPFWTAWNTINEKYPDAKKVSDQERVYGAIKGMTASLGDPYSNFFTPDETKIFEDDISGEFTGVGMEVGMKDKILTVIAPIKDSPAEKAGIKAGDKVLKINDKITSDLTVEQAIKLIRGDKGTTVTLTIFRAGEKEPREVKVVRDVIESPTIDTELRKDGIFVISLYSFSATSTDLFAKAIKAFTDSGSNKLVLDLRGNPGGYLDAAIDMSSYFLPSNKTVVIEDAGGTTKPKIYKSKGYDIFADGKLKFVILIDGGSASASEIVSGAMQDNGIATLVGEQSYGKGSVQEVINITPDTILKITTAKWLTPNGKSISEKGLTPDYVVHITKKDVDAKRDPQMDKAAELLNSAK